MSTQRRVLLARDAAGNPNHDPKNGEFASGSGGAGSGKTQPRVSVTTTKGSPLSKERVESIERPKGIGWSLKEAKEQSGKPNSVFERVIKGTGSSAPSKGKQLYSHSGGEEEINENDTYRAKDEQPDSPDMALDPNSEAVNSAVPWKGRNLDNDPVGDRCASPDMGAGSEGATWNGRTLD
jgi:hypothetical protein